MHDIEQKAIKLFQNNLDYFNENHKSIYEKIVILNQAIGEGHYKERYSLEYLDGYFDILELNSNQYLYNTNTKKYAKFMADSINFKKSDNVIEGFYKRREISDQAMKVLDETVNLKNQLFATAEIINYNKKVTSLNDEFEDIVKFIYAGVGLGLHLIQIQKKISAKVILIVENNLELFRLSLFTTDYKKLSKDTTLFFSILDDQEDFDVINTFLIKESPYNHYIKYSLLSDDYTKSIKKVQTAIVKSMHLIRPYTKSLREFIKAPEYIVEKYPFLNLKQYDSTPLINKPTLIIASGPSLDYNAKWLQKNKDKFLIIAVLSSISTLHKLDVKPNVVTHIDSEYDDITFFYNIDIDSFFKNTIFLLSSVVAKSIVNIVPKGNLYLFESASSYKKSSKIPSVPSIGETSYFFSLIFSAKEIYLLGLDLALDSETKSNHSKGHKEFREIKKVSKESENYMSLQNTILYTKGNFSKEVPTTALYQMSINAFNQISEIYIKEDVKVYNLNNGAYLQNTIPSIIEDVKVNNFDVLDKEEITGELKGFFSEISADVLDEDELLHFKEQIKEAERLLEYIDDYQLVVDTTSYHSYLKSFHKLYIKLLNVNTNKNYDINNILFLYLQNIIGYIFDILNTKDIDNSCIKDINDILIKQLKKLLNLYIKVMTIYLEWIEKDR